MPIKRQKVDIQIFENVKVKGCRKYPCPKVKIVPLVKLVIRFVCTKEGCFLYKISDVDTHGVT